MAWLGTERGSGPVLSPWSLQHEAVPSHPCSLVLSWVTRCVLLCCCHSVSVLPQRGDICKLLVRLAECRLLETNQRKAVKTEDWKKLSMSKDWMRWHYLAWGGEDWARAANSLQRHKCLFSKGKSPFPFFPDGRGDVPGLNCSKKDSGEMIRKAF